MRKRLEAETRDLLYRSPGKHLVGVGVRILSTGQDRTIGLGREGGPAGGARSLNIKNCPAHGSLGLLPGKKTLIKLSAVGGIEGLCGGPPRGGEPPGPRAKLVNICASSTARFLRALHFIFFLFVLRLVCWGWFSC